MTRPTALVLRSAGTNCDGETVRALELAGADVERMHLNALTKHQEVLDTAALVTIAGGFSYGDYVAAGRIFGLELRQRLGDRLRRFVERGGHLLGVCNGFQILVELGLFQPDREAHERTIALTDNASNRFECRWVHLRVDPSAVSWLSPGERFPVPVAHAEGRFVVRDDATLRELQERRQIVLRYVAPPPADGTAAADAGRAPGYPHNPNGSDGDIAGLCDPSGRVVGLMPHPERNLSPWNHPEWTRLAPRDEGEGVSFYRRLVAAAAGEASPPLVSQP